MNKILLKFDKYYFLVFLLCLFHIVNNWIILYFDNTPLLFDSAGRFINSINEFYGSTEAKGILKAIANPLLMALRGTGYPLVSLLAVPLYYVFGLNVDVGVMVNSIFIFILLFSVYEIGKRIYGKNVGILAAFIVSTYPIMFSLSRTFMTDFALAAMVCLSILLLILSKGFYNRINSILFGVSLGLGSLVRPTFFIFLFGPSVYFFMKSLTRKKSLDECRLFIINALLALIIGMAIASLWYIQNAIPNLIRCIKHRNLPSHFSDIFSGENLFYFTNLINTQIRVFYFIILLFSLLCLVASKPQKANFLFIWFILPFILFSSLPQKGARLVTGYLPAIALITALGINCVKPKRIRHILVSLTVLLGSAQFIFISYIPEAKNVFQNLETGPRWRRTEDKKYIWERHFFLHSGLLQAKRNDWKINDIIATLSEGVGYKKEIVVSGVYIDPQTYFPLVYEAAIRKMPLILYGEPGRGGFWNEKNIKIAKEIIMGSNYVLYGIANPEYKGEVIERDPIKDELERIFKSCMDAFVLIKEYELPNETFLLVYKNANLNDK